MSPEITKIIEQYLQNELSEADRAAFEQKLTESDVLLNEVILHRRLHEAAKRAAQRTLVQQTAGRYHFRKQLVTASVAILVAAAVTTAVVFALKSSRSAAEDGLSDSALTTLTKQLDASAPLDNIVPEYFSLAAKDTVVLSGSGVLLSVPEGAFLLDGKNYSGAKVVQWQEAIDAADIVKSGLSTTSGDRPLETQGMFGMQAFTPEGKRLTVNPNVGVYVQVPVDELKPGMQLFEGKKDHNGLIDWQNPQPLEKLPVLADMKDLDFYPPGYESELNALKWKTGKKDRDSLYLSFDEVPEGRPQGGAVLQHQEMAVARNTVTFPRMASDSLTAKENRNDSRSYYGTTGLSTGDLVSLSLSCNLVAENKARMVITGTIVSARKLNTTGPRNEYLHLLSSDSRITIQHYGTEIRPSGTVYAITAVYDITLHTSGDIYADASGLIEYYLLGSNKYATTNWDLKMEFLHSKNESEMAGTVCGIPPSKVLAFWQPKFNNTLLATRDFEQRMRSIHGTCAQAVLEKYTNNLNKPLYEIDGEVAAMGYAGFSEFAKERVGAVKLDNPHMNNLRQFYAHAVEQLKKAAKNDRDFVRKQEQAWDDELTTARTKEATRKVEREAKALDEEYNLNLRNVCRQLGQSVGFQIHGGGTVYNIDKYVMDATIARKTTVINDPGTGKSATITYNTFYTRVADFRQYDQCFLYLFPHELNSFQRVDPKNGLFDYPLNNDIIYDIAIVGMNEAGYHLYIKKGLNKGELGTVPLEHVSNDEFNSRIEALNKGRNSERKQMKITDELEWLLQEQKDYKVQRQRKESAAFRAKIGRTIFPCREELDKASSDEATAVK